MSTERLLCPEELPRADLAPLILVDGSNVAFGGNGIPRLRNLVLVLRQLKAQGLRVVTLVDASLRHHIDDPDGLEEMIRSEQVYQVPAGRTGDEFLTQLGTLAKRKGEDLCILTNDRFPDKGGNGTLPRIAYLVVSMGGTEEWMFSPKLDSVQVARREVRG